MTEAVLQEIGLERKRQDEKWGEQNHRAIAENVKGKILDPVREDGAKWSEVKE